MGKFLTIISLKEIVSMREREFMNKVANGKDDFLQKFIDRAVGRTVLGYDVFVAEARDVLQGKIWAAMDETRCPSKRQKDLADIIRLIESDLRLMSLLPEDLKKRLYPVKKQG